MTWKSVQEWLGPATLASTILGALIVGLTFIYSDTGPVAAIVATYLSFVVALFEGIHRQLQRTASHYEQLCTRFESPYMRQLARGLLDATGMTLELMLRPQREFRNEAQFFKFAEQLLSQLGAGDHVVVVCAETVRRWQYSKFIHKWLTANYAAAARGVVFSRILLGQPSEVLGVAVAQAARGIRIHLVEPAKLMTLPDLCRIPPDMGIAIVNAERVCMHWGADQTFYGCFVDSRPLAAVLLSVFATLEANGEPVSALEPPAA